MQMELKIKEEKVKLLCASRGLVALRTDPFLTAGRSS